MSSTKELIQKQLGEIKNLRPLPDSAHPTFKKWYQVTKTIVENKLGEKKVESFPSEYEFWPTRTGPWSDEEKKDRLLSGLNSAEAYLTGLIEEIELLGEGSIPKPVPQNESTKNQRFGNITVSGGTVVLGDGNTIKQVEVKEIVHALEKEIEEKVPESKDKKKVLESLKKITTNETFATVSGTVIGEILRRVSQA